MVACILEQELVMAVRRVDFGIRHVGAVVEQGAHDFARARRRKTPVGGEGHNKKGRLRARQRLCQTVAVIGGRIEIIERARDQQIGVCIEIFGEFVTLVTQVGLDLEINVVAELDVSVAQFAPESFRHHIV